MTPLPTPLPRTRHRAEAHDHAPRGGVGALALGALGVVYGDIGTSPLYAMDQIFRVAPSHAPEDALGAVSLVIWTLTLIVAIKYAVLVLRAQNDGEGGVFALYGLLHDRTDRRARMLLWALMAGAGLLIGDGMITPAISVLSAVEGLGVAAPGFAGLAVPITLGLLVALFAIQFKGASGVGVVFGPIVLVWFVAIAALGAAAIAANPEILAAFNPVHGLAFLGRAHLFEALLILGALMLVVTGGEAMYADVGHFGALPIRLSWFAVVYPALLLNYLGQGAYRMGGGPVADDKLFFALAPHWLVAADGRPRDRRDRHRLAGAHFRRILARVAGDPPRPLSAARHRAHPPRARGPGLHSGRQLDAARSDALTLVWSFGSSASLAAAYGLAVSGVMVITSVAMIPVALRHWRWSPATTALVWGPLTALNASFFARELAEAVRGRLCADRGRQPWPSPRWRPGAGAARRPTPRRTPRRR